MRTVGAARAGIGGRAIVLGLVTLLAVSGAAHAGVDWATGFVTADGIGIANRAAPSPAAARGPARRLAEDSARKRLAAQLPALPLAAGGTLRDRLADPAIKTAVDRAVANALTVAAEPETDGSWKITMAVPIEALRQAVAGGPRAVAAGSEDAPAVVIVEGVTAKPAIGYQLGALAAPTLFVKELPAWTKGAPRVKAKGTKGGVIDVAPGKATAATLFVIVGK